MEPDHERSHKVNSIKGHILKNLDSDFSFLGRSNFDILKRERLASLPGNSGLAVDDLWMSGGGSRGERRGDG